VTLRRRRLVRVPASSANLGPGFDVLGAALSLQLELEVQETERFAVQTELDVPLGDPAMGGHAGFALGLALARPERKVVLFDSEGDLLMSLGMLATIAEQADYLLCVRDKSVTCLGQPDAPAGPPEHLAAELAPQRRDSRGYGGLGYDKLIGRRCHRTASNNCEEAGELRHGYSHLPNAKGDAIDELKTPPR